MNLESQEAGGKRRLDAHNQAYAARFGIPPEKVPYAALNPDWFVTRIEDSWQREIAPGVIMSAHSLELGGGDYTNVYDVLVTPESGARLELLSFPNPRKPTNIFRNTPDLVAIANASFFYIIDDTDFVARQGPKDGTLNWCVRDGVLMGLPSADRPALFEIDGELYGREVQARGELTLNGQTLQWHGGQKIMHAPKDTWNEVYDPEQIVVFNSACTTITKESESMHGLRMLDKETYFTPKHPDAVALAVSLDENNEFRVQKIQHGGNMGLFDGHFILHVPKHLFESLQIKEGSVVSPISVDGIPLERVNSALTVGPSVKDYQMHMTERPIDTDKSFGQPPPFSESQRYARTIVFKDPSGIHMRLYDAVPVSTHFRGISPKEIAQNLSEDVEWSFFCDGGQSSLIGTRNQEGDVECIGNYHYATQKLSAMQARLAGEPAPVGSTLLGRRRPLPSVIGIRYRD